MFKKIFTVLTFLATVFLVACSNNNQTADGNSHKIVGGREWDYMSMYVLVAFIYWLLCFLVERAQGYIEKELSLTNS